MVAVDLPAGRWSWLLVGAWWPARPDAVTAAVAYWRQAGEVRRQEASDLHNARCRLGLNQGQTADDLMERYWRGEQRLATIARQCQVKSEQSDLVADAVNNLRDRLTEIAQSGNEEIDRILEGGGSTEAKVAAVNKVIAEKNASAAHAGGIAMSNIIDATQRVLDETIGGDARKWLRDHGVSLDGPSSSHPITPEDLKSPPEESPASSAFSGGQMAAIAPARDDAPETISATSPFRGGQMAPIAPARDDAPQTISATSPFRGGQMAPTAPVPGSVATPPPGAPAVAAGAPPISGFSAPGASTAPLSPQSLSQSFSTGMMTGAPAAAGAESLSAGTIHAATEPLLPTAPPTTAPLAAAPAVATAAAVPHVSDMSATAPPQPPVVAPTTDSGVTAVAPVVAGGPAAAPATPITGGPSAGPLPAYGSDLRPPVVAPPVGPSSPIGPVSGAAVAASPSSSPSAGASVLSPVTKSAPQASASQTASGATPLAGASAAATAGAVAGDSASRSTEQQRLRRIVDAVARQEPKISWAAGLRDNGRMTLLVTDLAGGWIPPHVRLPAHVALLEPAPRRHDASVEDLLGAVTVAAAHHPHGYLGEAGPDAPALTGDRTARLTATVDELGPTLAECVRRRDGLPRIAQAVAVAAARNYGVPDNEVDLLHERATEIQQSVLAAYPHHDVAAAVDWMLLASINALIEDNQPEANYHLAWAIAATSIRSSA